MPDPPPPQLPAHHPGQGTAPGFGQVRHLQQGGVQLVPGAQGGEDGDAPFLGLTDEIHLAGHQINAVHHAVVAVPEPLPVRGGVGPHQGVDPAVRVDVPGPLRQDLRLGPACGGGQGPQLAVDVAQAVRIPVNEGQLPHPGPGQHLGGAAAHAPQPHHAHMGPGQPVHGRGAQQHLAAQKSFVHECTLFCSHFFFDKRKESKENFSIPPRGCRQESRSRRTGTGWLHSGFIRSGSCPSRPPGR